MANFFDNKDRRVIPNWRSFKRTASLGELDILSSRQIVPDINVSIEDYKADFLKNKTLAHAGDLISAAIVNGFEDNEIVIEAANLILSNTNKSTQPQKNIAIRITSGKEKDLNHFNSFTLDKCDTYLDVNAIRKKLHSLKKASKNFPFNPIVWIELSRQYSIIGQEKKAVESMKIALQLAPENRYALRSAVRLFAHFGDFELPHDILRKSVLTNYDPWITSAEISLATLRGRSSRYVKKGIEMISSDNLSPFSFTELASSIGTLEIINGNNKRSRSFFSKALISPNDNSLAQIEWASNLDRLLVLNLDEYQVKHNYEANALDKYYKGDFSGALIDTFHWFLDIPYSKRPALLGSHISSLLDNHETERQFLNASLLAHPNDPQLLNNLAYSYALENMVDEADLVLRKIEHETDADLSTKICLLATKGLIYFRKGLVDMGRKLYLNSIQATKELNNEYYNWLAVLNYVREELLINSGYADTLIDTIHKIPHDRSQEDIKKLKSEVIDIYNKNKD